MPLWTPPVPATPWHQVGTIASTAGPTTSRYYIAGLAAAANLTGNITVVAGTSYALPYYTGHGGTIDSVQWRIATNQTGNAHVGIYANISNNILYPGSLLYSTADISTNTQGFLGPTGLTWSLPAGTLVWVVFQASSPPGMMAIPASAQWPILGNSTDPTNYPYPGTAWFGTGTYAAFPTTWQTDAVPNLMANIPAIFLRYSA
jgi:hypothetical protein